MRAEKGEHRSAVHLADHLAAVRQVRERAVLDRAVGREDARVGNQERDHGHATQDKDRCARP